VEAAQRLLGETSWSIKRIASRCGFGTEETMRRTFVRLLRATPQTYRERFASQRSAPPTPSAPIR
jgi:transcriptional regulator GlxA family with amidase domain